MFTTLNGRLEKSALNRSATEFSAGSQLLRPVQCPAAATTIYGLGDGRCKRTLRINTHHTTRRTAGQEIREALFNTCEQITEQHVLKLRKPGEVRWVERFNREGGAGALRHHNPRT